MKEAVPLAIQGSPIKIASAGKSDVRFAPPIATHACTISCKAQAPHRARGRSTLTIVLDTVNPEFFKDGDVDAAPTVSSTLSDDDWKEREDLDTVDVCRMDKAILLGRDPEMEREKYVVRK